MSNVVDERVVSMQFDNRQFERNAQTSISTLDKLKQSLKLDGASKGLENVNTAASKFDGSPLSNGVDAIRLKFSALEVMAVTALSNITNSALNAGKKIASALTIDPIKGGFQEYETQINAVQTILANTQSKGTNLDQVNSALDELNTYADKTIYNFTEMTRNIGTFTAAGVDLDTSVSAIKGISNLAAVSGSNSQQASTAMAQLSQALSSGTVKLMDWNSVVNAGMGGQVFQDALKDTARVHGIAIDDMVKSEGSFRETLQNGWLSSEILTETLSKFTGDLTDEQLKSMGYTQEQITEIQKLGETANDAATKVKTFTQLKDTLKEALQSGWTQSWEIMIGDFEEAKELWTDVSDYFGKAIGDAAQARNEMLQGWADGGGREMAIESLKNAFNGLLSIMKPINEAFSEVFPKTTSEQLLSITEKIRDLTANFKLTDSQSAKLKSTFKGLFSIVKIGVDAVKALAGGVAKLLGKILGLSGGLLDITGSLGDMVSGFSDSITESNIFEKTIEKITTVITNAIDKIKEFGSALKENIKTPDASGFIGFFKGLFEILTSVGSSVIEALSSIGSGIAKMFNSNTIGELLNDGILTVILLFVSKFVKSIQTTFDSGVSALENVTGILDDVRGCLQSYQENIKAGTLQKIAISIGILAASIFVISTIDPEDLANALTAITVLFGELLGALSIFNEMQTELKGVTKTVGLMIGMSVAVLILAGAMKILAGLGWDGLTKGLVGIFGIIGMLVLAAKTMDSESAVITKFAGQMILMSIAIGIVAVVCKMLGSMSWEELAKGGAGILGLTVMLVAAAKVMNSNSAAITLFAGQMLIMSIAIGILAGVCKILSSMSWEELAKGGAGILGLTVMLVAAAKVMNSNSAAITLFGAQLLLMSVSIAILAVVMKSIGDMSWESIAKGLVAIGISLGLLAIALNLMNGTAGGSASLLIAAAALAVLTPVLMTLGSMSVGEIAKALITLAGAFAVVGVAGYLLAPLVPVIFSLCASFALLGLGMTGIGIGLTLIGAGLTVFATALSVTATSLVASITIIIIGVLDLIPTIIEKIGETIIALCVLFGEVAPQIAEAIVKLIASVLVTLVAYMPQIVDSLMTLLVSVITGLAEHIPDLLAAIFTFISAIFIGIAEGIPNLDISAIVNAISAIVGGIVTILAEILRPILDVLSDVFVKVAPVIADCISQILAVVQPAIPPITEAFSTLAIAIGEAVSTIITAITPLVQILADLITNIVQIMADATVKIIEVLAPFMPNIQAMVDSVSQAILGICDAFIALVEQIAPIIDSISNLIGQLGDTIAQIFDSVCQTITTCGDTITQVLTAVSNSIGTVFSGIADIITSVGDSISSVLEAIADVITSIGDAALDAGTGFENLANGVATITGLNLVDMGASLAAVATGISDIADSADGLSSASTGISQIATGAALASVAFGTMTKAISNISTELASIGKVASTSMNTLSASVTKASTCFGSIGKAASSMSGQVSKSLTTTMTSALSSVTSKVGQFTAAGTKLMVGLSAGVTSGSSAIASVINSVITRAVSLVSSRQGLFQSAGVRLMVGLGSGIASGGSSISSGLLSALNSCVSTLNGYQGRFHSAGEFVAKGFASGIESKAYLAEAEAKAMAEKAVAAARKVLAVHSPSRVFKQIGTYVVQGFANGISNNENLAANSSSSMAQTAIDNVKGAIQTIGDIANTDYDIQPTIRPVMDMSGISTNEVQLGASISSAMVQPIDSLSTLISGAQAEIQASNNEVINSITGLRDDLTALFDTDGQEVALYVDSKKLASSLAKPMDRQLNILSQRRA